MPSDPIDPACGAVMMYAASCYERFNALTFEQCQAAANAASEASQREPLFMRGKSGKFTEFDIPHFGWRSSVYVAAIMSAWLVWTQRVIQNFSLPTSTLLRAAADGLALFDKDKLSEYWLQWTAAGQQAKQQAPVDSLVGLTEEPL